MPGSSIPDAIAAVVAVFDAANVPDLAVVDGPAYNTEGDTVAVGWNGETGVPVVQATNDPQDYGDSQGFEQYAISCVLSVWMGDEPLADARARLFGTYEVLRGRLALDRTLGGAVAQAWVGSYGLTQLPSTSTGYLLFDFTVDVKAFR